MSLELDDLEFLDSVRCCCCDHWYRPDECVRVTHHGLPAWLCLGCDDHEAQYKPEQEAKRA